jgi:hypothetical protein
MTTRYYSPSRCGFYSDDAHPTPADRPEDCFEVSEEQLRVLLDAQETGKEIHWDAEVGDFVAKRPAVLMEHIRAARNSKLRNTDWTQGRDVPESVSSQWAAYRQALRDIPDTYTGRPSEVVWPTPPS